VPFPHICTGSIGRIRTFRATSGFPFRLPLRFLLSRGNVNSSATVSYAPMVRHIFGYSKLARLFRKRKPRQGTSFASPLSARHTLDGRSRWIGEPSFLNHK